MNRESWLGSQGVWNTCNHNISEDHGEKWDFHTHPAIKEHPSVSRWSSLEGSGLSPPTRLSSYAASTQYQWRDYLGILKLTPLPSWNNGDPPTHVLQRASLPPGNNKAAPPFPAGQCQGRPAKTGGLSKTGPKQSLIMSSRSRFQ